MEGCHQLRALSVLQPLEVGCLDAVLLAPILLRGAFTARILRRLRVDIRARTHRNAHRTGAESKKPLKTNSLWWAHKGSNLGPLPCEGNALPLSYAPGFRRRSRKVTGPKLSVGERDLRSAGPWC